MNRIEHGSLFARLLAAGVLLSGTCVTLAEPVFSEQRLLSNGGIQLAQTGQDSADSSAMIELEFWRSVKDSEDAEAIGLYLEKYPKGEFAGLARLKLNKLKAAKGSDLPSVGNDDKKTDITSGDIAKPLGAVDGGKNLLAEFAEGPAKAPVLLSVYNSLGYGNFYQAFYPELKDKYVEAGSLRLVHRFLPRGNVEFTALMIASCMKNARFLDNVIYFIKNRHLMRSDVSESEALFGLYKPLGISKAEFNECLKNKALKQKFVDIVNRAEKEKIWSVPTYVVGRGHFGDGKALVSYKYVGIDKFEELKGSMDAFLVEAGKSREKHVTVKAQEKADTAEALYQLGLKHYEGKAVRQDFPKSAELFKRAAGLGSSKAMQQLGILYYNGAPGVEKNPIEAIRWFRKAAREEMRWALYYLGKAYSEGVGVEKDETEAIEWYDKAAKKGVTPAQVQRALMTDAGRGVSPDPGKAASQIFNLLARRKRSVLTELLRTQTDWSDTFRRELQSLLGQINLYQGPIDGEFGRGTVNALWALAGQIRKGQRRTAFPLDARDIKATRAFLSRVFPNYRIPRKIPKSKKRQKDSGKDIKITNIAGDLNYFRFYGTSVNITLPNKSRTFTTLKDRNGAYGALSTILRSNSALKEGSYYIMLFTHDLIELVFRKKDGKIIATIYNYKEKITTKDKKPGPDIVDGIVDTKRSAKATTSNISGRWRYKSNCKSATRKYKASGWVQINQTKKDQFVGTFEGSGVRGTIRNGRLRRRAITYQTHYIGDLGRSVTETCSVTLSKDTKKMSGTCSTHGPWISYRCGIVSTR